MIFDQEAADKAIRFIETYTIPTTVGKPVKLIPWQREYVSKLYGTKTNDGRRQYKTAICSTSKKQGKTLLQSGILLYELLGGVQPSPFCVSASTTRENAGQIWRELDYSIKANPKLKAICKSLESYKSITCKSKGSKYKAFSADAGGAEGENISALVVDELHAHQSDRLYRSLEYSTISRPDGLKLIISTAGSDQGSLWYDLFRYAQGVQDGSITDDTVLPAIYTTPENADIEDPAVWRLASPSMGVSFTEDDFRRDFNKAKQGGAADLLSFKRYRLNMWCKADDAFIDPVKYDRCKSPLTDDELRDKPLFVGVDLSQVADPCSVSCCWVLGDKKYYIRSHSWVCEEGVKRREQSNLPKYRAFSADGDMTITPGTVNDYRRIKDYILSLRQRYNLKEVIYDQYNAIEQCTELMAEGITVYRQPQNHKHYTSPMKEFEIAVNEERIQHDGNKLLRWALSNTRLDVDNFGNCKPSREKSLDKIDPCVSTLMAMGRAIEASANGVLRKSVYEGRGLFVV
jgi:phage terminase large subunit-like protein